MEKTKETKTAKSAKVNKIENSKSNRNFLNWLVYHLSNGVSFDEAISKTVKTFQNDADKGKAFTSMRKQIENSVSTLTSGCHNIILK